MIRIALTDKPLDVRPRSAAEGAPGEREPLLLAEMDLLFSRLIRKRVCFSDLVPDNATLVSERLAVRCQPLMTHACHLGDLAGAPALDDVPIPKRAPYAPYCLFIVRPCGR